MKEQPFVFIASIDLVDHSVSIHNPAALYWASSGCSSPHRMNNGKRRRVEHGPLGRSSLPTHSMCDGQDRPYIYYTSMASWCQRMITLRVRGGIYYKYVCRRRMRGSSSGNWGRREHAYEKTVPFYAWRALYWWQAGRWMVCACEREGGREREASTWLHDKGMRDRWNEELGQKCNHGRQKVGDAQAMQT